MFHLLTYTNKPAGVVTLANAGMVADGSAISQGTTGYRLYQQFRLLGAYVHAALITQAELRSSTLDGLARWNIWPLNTSLNNPSNPQIDDYRAFTPILPQFEDMNLAYSDTAAAGEQMDAHLWLGTPGWTSDLSSLNSLFSGNDPYVGRRLTVNCAPTLNKGAQAWGADAALTFEQLPRSGAYAVIGGECVAAGCSAWRLSFPSMPMYSGKKLFPGDITMNALGDVPKKQGRNWLGVWGVFHSLELPFASLYGQAAGQVTVNLNLDVVYLGGSQDPSSVMQRAMSMLSQAA